MAKSTVVVVGRTTRVTLKVRDSHDVYSKGGVSIGSLPTDLGTLLSKPGLYRVTRVKKGGVAIEVRPTTYSCGRYTQAYGASYGNCILACHTLLKRLDIAVSKLPMTVHIKVERLSEE